jgi:peptide deformylase
MAVREIITTPNPILRERAKRVRSVNRHTEQLIEDMIDTVRAAPGVGLAAPQIGVSQQVIVVEYAEGSEDPEAEPKPPKLYAIVNPEIVRQSKETEISNEGCLSVPGFVGEVERPKTVTIKGLDRHGKPFRIKAKDWLARIFQHEIDHLHGILYIDQAENVYRIEEDELAESTGVV